MDIVIGDAVTGKNMYGREQNLKVLWERIGNNSILLSSPRRFGKTSLVREMQRKPKYGFQVIYVDVEGVKNTDEFVLKMACKINRSRRQTVLKLLGGIRESTEEIGFGNFQIRLRESKISWQEKGNRLFNVIQKQSIIVLDELPSFLQTLEERKGGVREFMLWLREIRQTYGIRFILCGSVGIDSVLDRHVLGNSINDLERITVPPFDNITATGMITKILKEYKVSYQDTHVAMILKNVGIAVPYFVQLMLREIIDETDYGRMELTGDIVLRAYENSILGDEGSKYFKWYYDRLKIEFTSKDHYLAVEKMLDHLAKNNVSSEQDLEKVFSNEMTVKTAHEFRDTVRILKDGFYIIGDPHYKFANKVLRDLWIKDRRL